MLIAARIGASTIGAPLTATAASAAMQAGAQEIGADHQLPAVETVGEDAAERAEDDHRKDAGGGGDADPGRGPRAVVHEREEGEVVEPVAGLRRGQAGEQEPQIARAAQRTARAG